MQQSLGWWLWLSEMLLHLSCFTCLAELSEKWLRMDWRIPTADSYSHPSCKLWRNMTSQEWVWTLALLKSMSWKLWVVWLNKHNLPRHLNSRHRTSAALICVLYFQRKVHSLSLRQKFLMHAGVKASMPLCLTSSALFETNLKTTGAHFNGYFRPYPIPACMHVCL